MLKQLPYFHSIEDDLSRLTQASQTLTSLLADAYSSDAPLCTVQNQIDLLIDEQQHLQNVIASIELQVATNSFIPQQLDQMQLKIILKDTYTLPQWFSSVIDQQYVEQRKEFNRYAIDLFKMHALSQKKKTLMEERERVMTLSRRNISLQRSGSGGIDLLEQVGFLKDRIKHVRKSYQFFCNQVAKKISEWVSLLAQKSKNFHNNKNNAHNEAFNSRIQPLNFSFKRQSIQPPIIASKFISERTSNMRNSSQDNYYAQLSRTFKRQASPIQKKFNLNAPKTNIIKQRHISPTPIQSSDYFSNNLKTDRYVAKDCLNHLNYRSQSKNKFDYSRATPLKLQTNCTNHNYSSTNLHQHTCSQNLNSPRNDYSQYSYNRSPQGKIFDYRTVVTNHYYD